MIDYRTSQGSKLYSKATSALDYDEPFDCTAEFLFAFVKPLGDRLTAFGWNTPGVGIMRIRTKDSTDDAPKYENPLQNYGQISMQRIRAQELTYISQPCRAKQDTHCLYACLMASLSKAGKAKVLIWEPQYTVGEEPSGVLLL